MEFSNSHSTIFESLSRNSLKIWGRFKGSTWKNHNPKPDPSLMIPLLSPTRRTTTSSNCIGSSSSSSSSSTTRRTTTSSNYIASSSSSSTMSGKKKKKNRKELSEFLSSMSAVPPPNLNSLPSEPQKNFDLSSLATYLSYNMKTLAWNGGGGRGSVCCVNQKIVRGHFKYHEPRLTFARCKPRCWKVLQDPKMPKKYFLTTTPKIAIVNLVEGRSDAILKAFRCKILLLWSPASKHKRLKDYYDFGCEILDTDTWRWKELDSVWVPPGVTFSGGPLVIASVVYWLMTDNLVHAFDVSTDRETHDKFELPHRVMYEKVDGFVYEDKQLVEYKGRLAFVCRAEADDEDDFHLWVMLDCRNRVWRRLDQGARH